MDSGAKLKMPNVIRSLTRSTVVNQYLMFCKEENATYLKMQRRNHCHEPESSCPDHCLKFGLSDPNIEDFNETCAHEHTTRYDQCDNISTCINKIEQAIKHESLMFYRKGQQQEIVYDLEQAVRAINQWKAHICEQQIKNVLNKTCLQSLT